ncbi:hypothetical protein F2Q69_00040467 [Brassica cretica]|uniref:Uncharacterized protein n=1 Tax=Brassica cretica TaxID=69181 RepID=A0A8S9NKZ8_BRACR|nr:hypothetical protein F2Q69_00040467 [Brassica cretica]
MRYKTRVGYSTVPELSSGSVRLDFIDSGDSPQMDTRVSGTAVVQKDMRECINDIEKAGFGPRAVARDRMFKAKSKKIGQLLNDSRDSLIRSLHETVEADRKKNDADIEMKTALLNSAGSARQS